MDTTFPLPCGLSREHAADIDYEGRFYVAWSAMLPAAKGEALGHAGYPACHDGSGCEAGDPETTARPTEVWALRGVARDRVVVARGEGTDRLMVYGRLHLAGCDGPLCPRIGRGWMP